MKRSFLAPGTVLFLLLMLKEDGKMMKGGREGAEGHGEGRK